MSTVTMSTVTMAISTDAEEKVVTFVARYPADSTKTLTLRFVPSGDQEGEDSILDDANFWEMCRYEMLTHLAGAPRIKTATWEYELERDEDDDQVVACWEAEWVMEPEYHD